MHDNITIFRLVGNSMRPYLVGGRDKAIVESPAENVRKGDVVVARLCSGETIMHRVVKIEGTNVTLLGDGNIKPEHCNTTDKVKPLASSARDAARLRVVRISDGGFIRSSGHAYSSCDDTCWELYD